MKQKYNTEILEKCLPPYLENDLKNLKIVKLKHRKMLIQKENNF